MKDLYLTLRARLVVEEEGDAITLDPQSVIADLTQQITGELDGYTFEVADEEEGAYIATIDLTGLVITEALA